MRIWCLSSSIKKLTLKLIIFALSLKIASSHTAKLDWELHFTESVFFNWIMIGVADIKYATLFYCNQDVFMPKPHLSLVSTKTFLCLTPHDNQAVLVTKITKLAKMPPDVRDKIHTQDTNASYIRNKRNPCRFFFFLWILETQLRKQFSCMGTRSVD